MRNRVFCRIKRQEGATLVIFAGLLVAFLAFVALAVDIAHLYVVKNELQNAADAGALAAAQVLFYPDASIDPTANDKALQFATANKSDNVPVAVDVTADVQRGHYFQFQPAPPTPDKAFQPNDTTVAHVLYNQPSFALDADDKFVNAVMVVPHSATPAASFFARILGFDGFTVSAEAIAVRGFAGSPEPNALEEPIVICRQVLGMGSNYACPYTNPYPPPLFNAKGYMITTSGSSTSQIGGFTNFTQPSPCTGAAPDAEVGALVCGSGNSKMLNCGQGLQARKGLSTSYSLLRCGWLSQNPLNGAYNPSCSQSLPRPTAPWQQTLAVVDCPNVNSIDTCANLVGVVVVNILWMTRSDDCDAGNIDARAPDQMGSWSSSLTGPGSGPTRWDSFVDYFHIKMPNGTTPAWYANGGCINSTVYYQPD